MRPKVAVVLAVSILPALALWTAAADAPRAAAGGLAGLAQTAFHGSPADATAAIAGLRQAGPAGMDAALAVASSAPPSATLDQVCGVRDCADLRLFWYTDFEAAKAAAQATGKPILSLRLLGRLDEEFSCANSRFFRTVFYKNKEINDLLRDRFVLHWRSLRPVPRVTIDFGDGTRLERTLTGNSIHYVLDSHGRLVEALPGLYGPEAFQSALEKAGQTASQAANLEDTHLAPWLEARHERELNARWIALRRELGSLSPAPRAAAGTAPALETASKAVSERSLLEALAEVDDDQLRALARQRRPRVHLDTASRDFLLRKHGVKDSQEATRLVDSFETTIALDEVINEYRTGPAILKKLIDPITRSDFDLEAFNLWVYEDVFRTPLSDPWLGLASEDVYVALPAATRTALPGASAELANGKAQP